MKYLILSPDPFGIPLREEGKPPGSSWPISVSDLLRARIFDWNDRFGFLISADHLYGPEEFSRNLALLNTEGKSLSKALELELSPYAKVTYYPEQ